MMTYDYKAQKRKNEAHLANPQIGDYWDEMFLPVATVVGLYRGRVIFERPRTGEIESLTLDAFRKWLSYGSIPGTWADVLPASERKRKSA